MWGDRWLSWKDSRSGCFDYQENFEKLCGLPVLSIRGRSGRSDPFPEQEIPAFRAEAVNVLPPWCRQAQEPRAPDGQASKWSAQLMDGPLHMWAWYRMGI